MLALSPRPDEGVPDAGSASPAPSHDLAVLSWPKDAAEAERLRREGVPRLLLVPREERPPHDVDHLAEWVRVPAEEREVAARVVALLRRAGSFAVRPHMDDHGRISYGGRWAPMNEKYVGARLPISPRATNSRTRSTGNTTLMSR